MALFGTSSEAGSVSTDRNGCLPPALIPWGRPDAAYGNFLMNLWLLARPESS